VVYGAERLADPEVAANLSTNVALVTTTVTLPPKLEELCGRDYARELAFEDLITALPKQPHVRRVDGGELFPVVPDDDFITFRATCRALLEREEFERVDRRLRIGVRATTHWLKTNQPDGEHLADYLRAEFTQLPTTHEKITLIRAAQIACLRGGYLLKVKTSQLLAVLTDENPGMLTPQVAERLRAYTNPIEPALAVVSLACQVNHYSLADIRLEDVSQEAETVRIDGTAFRIPLFARGIVRSQVAVRELNGAGPDEFLFMAATPTTENGRERVSAREIRRLLNQVAIETGVINLQHHTLRDMDAARWMSGRGLSLQRIEAE
jgi:hypothetical protein